MCLTVRLDGPYLDQGCLRLGSQEGHAHGPVYLKSRRECPTGRLPLPTRGVQQAQASVTVGLERVHAKFFGHKLLALDQFDGQVFQHGSDRA